MSKNNYIMHDSSGCKLLYGLNIDEFNDELKRYNVNGFLEVFECEGASRRLNIYNQVQRKEIEDERI